MTALLVVRVWRESGAMRARVTSTQDVEHDPPAEVPTASPTELKQIVEEWLDAMLRN